MFIECKTYNKCDIYYIPDTDNIDTLHKHVENSIPLGCYEVESLYHGDICLVEELKNHTYINLNKYLSYNKIDILMINLKTYNEITTKYCSNCKLFEEYRYCGHSLSRDGCKGFEKKPTLKDSIDKMISNIKQCWRFK